MLGSASRQGLCAFFLLDRPDEGMGATRKEGNKHAQQSEGSGPKPYTTRLLDDMSIRGFTILIFLVGGCGGFVKSLHQIQNSMALALLRAPGRLAGL